MQYAGFQLDHCGDVPVLHRRDDRFKTFRVVLCAQRPIDDRTAARALLPALLVEGTERHRDRVALARALELHFGASVLPAVGRLGESSVLRLAAEAVAGDFLPGRPDQFGAVVDLLADYAARPRLDGGGFPDPVFAREHALAVAMAAAVFDDKNHWARQQVLLRGCRGEPYAIPDHGGDAALQQVDRFAPEAARLDFLRHGRQWCVAMGALPDDLPARLQPLFAVLPAPEPQPVPPPVQPERREPSRSVEAAVMQQARQMLLFRLPRPLDVATLCAQHAMVSMLGGGTHSRLFREVREKRSLVYHIGAGLDQHKGLMLVQAGMQPGSAAAVEQETLQQLAQLAAGSFDDAELRTALATLMGPFAAVDDSLAARMQFTAEQFLYGFDQTPAGRLQSYAAVDRDQVAAAAASLWLDHSYLLHPEASA